ncbi:MAG: NUDIX domain-containing protein [Syntrophotaleaceae bacterium]
MVNTGEVFDIVDEQDRIIGQAHRSLCHGNPDLIHRVAHVLVLNSRGEVLLQKRSMTKDVQPGRWDTSVGGHLNPGESYRCGAIREMREELGISVADPIFLYAYKMRNDFESENIATYLVRHDGEVYPEPGEIDQVRFFSRQDIEEHLGKAFFTPNFEDEWARFSRIESFLSVTEM